MTFSRNKVTWEVFESNHGAERAHKTLVSHVLFDYLKNISWSKGTGGYILGNNEYNQDSKSPRDYIALAFGPLGEEGKKSYVYYGQ